PNLTQIVHTRPQNRFEDLEGVYLVGGGTHPGSGLPVIYESARITSRLLLQEWELAYDHCLVGAVSSRPTSPKRKRGGSATRAHPLAGASGLWADRGGGVHVTI